MEKHKPRENILKDLYNGKIDKYYEFTEDERVFEKEIGILKLPTGKIVANDYLRFYETEPFIKSVAPGEYPVYLYIHEYPGESYNSFAEIRFSDKKPVKFELAYTEENKNIKLTKGEYTGFRSESGASGFMDESLALNIKKYGKKDFKKFRKGIDKLCAEDRVDFCEYADFTPQGEKSNIIVFSSCFDKSNVASFWCYDSSGEVCRLVTDCQEIIDDFDITFEFDPWGKAYDYGFGHSMKIRDNGFDLDTAVGFNHLAVFFRWMAEHNLVSHKLVSEYPSLISGIARNDIDLRNIIRFSPKFNGELCRDHFTKLGQKFADRFYTFKSNEGFPHCVDEFALEYFGEEKYSCKEYNDEAYLFLPYSEEYYNGLSKYIDDAWAIFRGKM